MTKNIIVAVDNKWGISKDGKIPWHYPEDFAWFKRITMDCVCVMGRNTFDDLLTYSKGKTPLPGRELHVVTSTSIESHNVTIHRTIPRELKTTKPVFYIGGVSIYDTAIEFCDKIIISAINRDYNCDKFFNYKKMEGSDFVIDDYISLSDSVTVSIFKRNVK